MGQKIGKKKFWRKKKGTSTEITRGFVAEENETLDKLKDIAIRTAKTFAQVALGVIVTSIANPSESIKPVLTTAVASGACAAMNFIIKCLESGDIDDT